MALNYKTTRIPNTQRFTKIERLIVAQILKITQIANLSIYFINEYASLMNMHDSHQNQDSGENGGCQRGRKPSRKGPRASCFLLLARCPLDAA
jgi:hypothetical protein